MSSSHSARWTLFILFTEQDPVGVAPHRTLDAEMAAPGFTAADALGRVLTKLRALYKKH